FCRLTTNVIFCGLTNGTENGEAISAMLNTIATTNSESSKSLLVAEWYALQTRPRHEKVVKYSLESAGIETFLPLCPQVRTWSDRRKVVEFPLFPGYIFARPTWSMQARVRAFQANGVIAFVG